jgi:hypothetical protein
MKHAEATLNEFYQMLGKVFYAIAAADKVVRPEEKDALKKIIRNDWLPHDNAEDEFGTDAAYQIETVFDWLTENNQDTKQLLKEFENFKAKHESLFTPDTKKLIRKTSLAVAEAFSGKNKSELIMLTQLSSLLNS